MTLQELDFVLSTKDRYIEQARSSEKIKWCVDYVTRTVLFYSQMASQLDQQHPDLAVSLTNMTTVKTFHTNDVICAMVDVFPFESRSYEEFELAVCLAIVHDVARLPQVVITGSFVDTFQYLDDVPEATFSHMVQGAQMIERTKPLLSRSTGDQLFSDDELELLRFGVQEHGKKDADPSFLVSAIRDADKLGILREIDEILARLYTNQPNQNILNPAMIEEFSSQVMTNKLHCISKADRCLNCISWIFDLNFQETRERFAQEAIPSRLLRILDQMGVDSQELRFLEGIVIEWHQQYGLSYIPYSSIDANFVDTSRQTNANRHRHLFV